MNNSTRRYYASPKVKHSNSSKPLRPLAKMLRVESEKLLESERLNLRSKEIRGRWVWTLSKFWSNCSINSALILESLEISAQMQKNFYLKDNESFLRFEAKHICSSNSPNNFWFSMGGRSAKRSCISRLKSIFLSKINGYFSDWENVLKIDLNLIGFFRFFCKKILKVFFFPDFIYWRSVSPLRLIF